MVVGTRGADQLESQEGKQGGEDCHRPDADDPLVRLVGLCADRRQNAVPRPVGRRKTSPDGGQCGTDDVVEVRSCGKCGGQQTQAGDGHLQGAGQHQTQPRRVRGDAVGGFPLHFGAGHVVEAQLRGGSHKAEGPKPPTKPVSMG